MTTHLRTTVQEKHCHEGAASRRPKKKRTNNRLFSSVNKKRLSQRSTGKLSEASLLTLRPWVEEVPLTSKNAKGGKHLTSANGKIETKRKKKKSTVPLDKKTSVIERLGKKAPRAFACLTHEQEKKVGWTLKKGLESKNSREQESEAPGVTGGWKNRKTRSRKHKEKGSIQDGDTRKNSIQYFPEENEG